MKTSDVFAVMALVIVILIILLFGVQAQAGCYPRHHFVEWPRHQHSSTCGRYWWLCRPSHEKSFDARGLPPTRSYIADAIGW
jgi:hypothetical protein